MKLITRDLLDGLGAKAQSLPRRRTHHNLHDDLSAPVQRLFVALQPGSYVRPHCHREPNKWELLVAIAGRLAVLIFEPDGRLRERLELAPDGDGRAVEFPPGTWHAVVALAPDSVMLEVKQGPYQPTPAADFAAWAPAEGDPDAAAFEAWMRQAAAGERAPGA